MRTNKTKAKLARGEVVFGSFVGIPSPGVVELLAYAGLDFVVIDAEHAPMDIAVIEAMVRAADAADIDTLVRIQHIDETEIVRYLDLGVLGVQAPHTDTADQLRAAVRAVKYYPMGMRGMGFARAAQFANTPQARADHIEASNRETMIVCQIESKEGVENLPELLTVDGVDVFFIGTSDLSQSLGYPGQRTHPEVQKAVDRVFDLVTKSNRVLGTTNADLEGYVKNGARYITSLDAKLLMTGAHQFLDQGHQAIAAAGR